MASIRWNCHFETLEFPLFIVLSWKVELDFQFNGCQVSRPNNLYMMSLTILDDTRKVKTVVWCIIKNTHIKEKTDWISVSARFVEKRGGFSFCHYSLVLQAMPISICMYGHSFFYKKLFDSCTNFIDSDLVSRPKHLAVIKSIINL